MYNRWDVIAVDRGSAAMPRLLSPYPSDGAMSRESPAKGTGSTSCTSQTICGFVLAPLSLAGGARCCERRNCALFRLLHARSDAESREGGASLARDRRVLSQQFARKAELGRCPTELPTVRLVRSDAMTDAAVEKMSDAKWSTELLLAMLTHDSMESILTALPLDSVVPDPHESRTLFLCIHSCSPHYSFRKTRNQSRRSPSDFRNILSRSPEELNRFLDGGHFMCVVEPEEMLNALSGHWKRSSRCLDDADGASTG